MDAPHGQVPCNLRSQEMILLSGIDSHAYSNFERSDEGYLKHFSERNKLFAPQINGGRNNAFLFQI